MKDYIRNRVIKTANYTIATESTVRNTAKKFGVSKSTVHKDLRERLPEINYMLYKKVDVVLNKNLLERHIRGGMATRDKYKGKRKIS